MRNLLVIAIAGAVIGGCGQASKGGNAAGATNQSLPSAANDAMPASTRAGPSTAEVATMIERDGATRTVQTLDQGETVTRFTQVLESIASGDPQWLALVPRLGPGVDAGTSTGLIIAVAEALPRNAAGVLGLAVAGGWSLDDACSYPMIEPTAAEKAAYFAAVMPAVEAVADPALQDAKAACLTRLRAAQAQAN